MVPPPPVPPPIPPRAPASERLQRLRFGFARTGTLALLSHLDTLRLLERALRRSGLPVSFTGGFHPLPRLQLALPLPLGAEGLGEWLDLEFAATVDPGEVHRRLEAVLPAEFALLSVRIVPLSAPSLSQELEAAEWWIEFLPPGPAAAVAPDRWQRAVGEVVAAERLIWHDHDKKGRPRQRDCRPFLRGLGLLPHPQQINGGRWLALDAAIDPQGRSLRPEHPQRWLAEALEVPLRMGRVQRRRLILRSC